MGSLNVRPNAGFFPLLPPEVTDVPEASEYWDSAQAQDALHPRISGVAWQLTMHLDSCLPIDLHREKFRRQNGPAHQFLRTHAGEPLSVSVAAAMDYREDFEDEELWKGQRLLEPFEILPIDRDTAVRGNRIRRSLQTKGQLLPDSDILIAACAAEKDQALVTRDADHFRRFEGLKMVAYRD